MAAPRSSSSTQNPWSLPASPSASSPGPSFGSGTPTAPRNAPASSALLYASTSGGSSQSLGQGSSGSNGNGQGVAIKKESWRPASMAQAQSSWTPGTGKSGTPPSGPSAGRTTATTSVRSRSPVYPIPAGPSSHAPGYQSSQGNYGANGGGPQHASGPNGSYAQTPTGPSEVRRNFRTGQGFRNDRLNSPAPSGPSGGSMGGGHGAGGSNGPGGPGGREPPRGPALNPRDERDRGRYWGNGPGPPSGPSGPGALARPPFSGSSSGPSGLGGRDGREERDRDRDLRDYRDRMEDRERDRERDMARDRDRERDRDRAQGERGRYESYRPDIGSSEPVRRPWGDRMQERDTRDVRDVRSDGRDRSDRVDRPDLRDRRPDERERDRLGPSIDRDRRDEDVWSRDRERGRLDYGAHSIPARAPLPPPRSDARSRERDVDRGYRDRDRLDAAGPVSGGRGGRESPDYTRGRRESPDYTRGRARSGSRGSSGEARSSSSSRSRTRSLSPYSARKRPASPGSTYPESNKRRRPSRSRSPSRSVMHSRSPSPVLPYSPPPRPKRHVSPSRSQVGASRRSRSPPSLGRQGRRLSPTGRERDAVQGVPSREGDRGTGMSRGGGDRAHQRVRSPSPSTSYSTSPARSGRKRNGAGGGIHVHPDRAFIGRRSPSPVPISLPYGRDDEDEPPRLSTRTAQGVRGRSRDEEVDEDDRRIPPPRHPHPAVLAPATETGRNVNGYATSQRRGSHSQNQPHPDRLANIGSANSPEDYARVSSLPTPAHGSIRPARQSWASRATLPSNAGAEAEADMDMDMDMDVDTDTASARNTPTSVAGALPVGVGSINGVIPPSGPGGRRSTSPVKRELGSTAPAPPYAQYAQYIPPSNAQPPYPPASLPPFAPTGPSAPPSIVSSGGGIPALPPFPPTSTALSTPSNGINPPAAPGIHGAGIKINFASVPRGPTASTGPIRPGGPVHSTGSVIGVAGEPVKGAAGRIRNIFDASREGTPEGESAPSDHRRQENGRMPAQEREGDVTSAGVGVLSAPTGPAGVNQARPPVMPSYQPRQPIPAGSSALGHNMNGSAPQPSVPPPPPPCTQHVYVPRQPATAPQAAEASASASSDQAITTGSNMSNPVPATANRIPEQVPVAPYIKLAFDDWYSRTGNAGEKSSASLPDFIVHYFGRPPTEGETKAFDLLWYQKQAEQASAPPRPDDPTQTIHAVGEAGTNGAIPTASSTPTHPQPDTQVHAQPSHNLAPGEVYERLDCVGQGTYGKVYKARNVYTNAFVALKRIRMEGEKEGFPVTAMREIKLLQGLRHKNVIRLVEMMVSTGSVYMVFEYMELDLTGLLAHPDVSFTPANIKSLTYQMLDGLAYLHDRSILHRDLKGSNILLSSTGILKLADFGLARFYNKRARDDYTNRVITLWYRSPELLLGETVYQGEVDMWSAGCIALELFITKPVFQGHDEISQLQVIWDVLGTPDSHGWASVEELPWYELVRPKVSVPDKFDASFQKWLPTGNAMALVKGMLAFDPVKRISAAQAMKHEYFEEEPQAEVPDMTGMGEWHEMDAKMVRRKKEGR